MSKSETVAAENFKRAGELGHVEATTAFGVMLVNGIGIQQDVVLASSWFRKGIEMNDANAHWLLGK